MAEKSKKATTGNSNGNGNPALDQASAPAATTTAPGPAGKPARRKVVAIAIGFYNHVRRRPGDVFYLNNPTKDFSKKWMMDAADWKAQQEAEKEAAEEAAANAGGDETDQDSL